MNPITIGISIAGVLGVGGGAVLVVHEVNKNKSPLPAASVAAISTGSFTPDPGMDSYDARILGQALTEETNPAILNQYAQLLSNAGYSSSARAAQARASQLQNNIGG